MEEKSTGYAAQAGRDVEAKQPSEMVQIQDAINKLNGTLAESLARVMKINSQLFSESCGTTDEKERPSSPGHIGTIKDGLYALSGRLSELNESIDRLEKLVE